MNTETALLHQTEVVQPQTFSRRSEEEEGEEVVEEEKKKQQNTGVGLGFYFLVLGFISLATPTVCGVMMLVLRRRSDTSSYPVHTGHLHPWGARQPGGSEEGAATNRKLESSSK